MNKIILALSMFLFSSSLWADRNKETFESVDKSFAEQDRIRAEHEEIALKLKKIESKYNELDKEKKKINEELADIILVMSDQKGNILRKNELLKSLNNK